MDLSALRYAKTHEWAKRDGDLVTVGITQYAAEQLGDVTHLQLPKVGAATTAGKPFGEIESVTERGRALGATVLLEPREGPAGWRSVLATSEGGEIALWQRKSTGHEGSDD